jgi:3-hydroxybutyryl-CoA dehydrogenase
MGGGIAQVLALSGARVALSDVSADAATAGYERLVRESRQFVDDGLFPAGAPEVLEANLWVASSIEEAVSGAEFIEESVPEVIELKRSTLSVISAAAPPGSVMASNTSTIAIGALAQAVKVPERFLGVHFSNPAPFIPGVELIPHSSTSPSALATAREVVAACGKQGALVHDATGFVLNRLQYALFSEAAQLVEEGVASVEDVDLIVRTTFGFRLPFFGPFAVADMAGLDVYAFCYKSLAQGFPGRFTVPRALQDLVDAGHLGTKSGGGFVNLPPEGAAAVVAYRNRAYVAMQKLLDELGPAPI